MQPPRDPAIPPPHIYPEKRSRYLHTTFTTALVTTAKLWKHKCPSEDEYTKRGLSIQRNIILSSPRCKGCKAFPLSRASSRQSCLSRGDSSILQKLPSRRPPSPSDLDSGATPWGVGTRRVALLATQSDRDPAAENRQLGASFPTRDRHRQGKGLLGTWVETDLVCRTQRLSLGLSLGYSSEPAGSGRPERAAGPHPCILRRRAPLAPPAPP